MENDDLSRDELMRRYSQLATAMGADLGLATHEDCVKVAFVLNRVKTAIVHSRPEETGAFFVCGASEKLGGDGLPEQIMICPAYGLDGFALYEKKKDWREGSGS